ncbi:MAG: methylated-DNA--[protein]-cysteine S-methyltransferase [Opitutaceae bacterium]|jgi:methylated-DNA-[protein]-cysteine S-methyltransferase
MTQYYDTFDTPFGVFLVALNAAGEVIATAFGERERLQTGLDTGELQRSADRVRQAREEILAYFDEERRSFTVKLSPQGTAFQQEVWAALLRIPYGETRSYGQLAAALGRPGSARAIGRAVATNPICLLIPCHRVIGSDGSLTGFAYGTEIKRRLLDLEAGQKGR